MRWILRLLSWACVWIVLGPLVLITILLSPLLVRWGAQIDWWPLDK